MFASANGMRELIGQAGLTVPIFDPKIYGEISLAGNNLKVAEYRLRLARLFTAARITQYFYGLILLKDEIKIERKALGGAAYGEDTVNSFDAPNLGWQFFVILNIPIYNFGLRKDYIDAASERLMALKSAESAVKLSVKKRLTIDYGTAAASKKKIYGAKILVKKSGEVFKMTKEGYLAGAFNAFELQAAQNNQIKSHLELAKAVNEFYLAISQLDIDMGIIPSGDGKL